MSADTHTPGPWVIDAPYLSEIQTAGRLTIASCWYADADGAEITVTGILPCSPEESAANARLIAAAPDLLEALREVLVIDEVPGAVRRGIMENVAAAIAKATGESQ